MRELVGGDEFGFPVHEGNRLARTEVDVSREGKFLVQLTKRRHQQGNDDVPVLSEPATHGPGQRQVKVR